MIELNRDTKLKNIVPAYPSLKTRLAELNSKFGLLPSPIGKILIDKATVSDMRRRSRIDINSLTDEIRRLMKDETL